MNSSAESSALTRRPVLGALGALAAASLGGTAGCMSWPEPTVPMRVRHIAARCAPQRRVVLLPGVRSLADDFVHEGFVAQLQRAAPACEVLLADAHLGYFVEGQLLRRLRDDVLRPAVVPAGGGRTAANDATNSATSSATHRAALERPWLVGVSLGGLMALAYAMRHGDELAGVLASRRTSASARCCATSRPPAGRSPGAAGRHRRTSSRTRRPSTRCGAGSRARASAPRIRRCISRSGATTASAMRCACCSRCCLLTTPT